MSEVTIRGAVVFGAIFVLVSVAFIPAVNAQFSTNIENFVDEKSRIINNVYENIKNFFQKIDNENTVNTIPIQPIENCSLFIDLPSDPVFMVVKHTSTNSYFNTTLSNVSSGYDVSNGSYCGWCIDLNHHIYDNVSYQVSLYSSYNTSMPSHCWHNNLSMVNYILNNKQGFWRQVQYAIWYVLDFRGFRLNDDGWAMVNDAIANGSNFCPGVGDVTAIIADAGTNTQCTVFELPVPVYTLSVYTNGNGSVTPTGGTFASGTEIDITAIAESGWSFSYWSGDLNSSNNPVTITMTSNKTVTAHFTQSYVNYTLNTSTVGSGSVSLNPLGGNYVFNTVVSMTAEADYGWSFSHWSGDLNSSHNPEIITMTDNKTVTAHFTQSFVNYTLNVSIVGSGLVELNPTGGIYPNNTVVNITAVADPGWSFSHWSGDLNGINNPVTITINSDKTVTAHFTQDQYILTVTIIGNGTVIQNPNQITYTYGTLVELTAVAEPGWTFSYWNNDLGGSDNPETIGMNGDKYVTATFTQDNNTYALNIDIIGKGIIEKDPDQNTYFLGTTVKLTANANSGWGFSHWSNDLSGSDNPVTINMTSNKSVTANFKTSSGQSGSTNQNPSADANGPYSGLVDEEITFDGSGSSDDGTITNYTWDFGDDTKGYEVNPTHSYNNPGKYTVILKVTDNDGATDTDDTTADIVIPNRPPSGPEISGPQNGTKNTEYTFTVVSTDPDDDTISYNFNWDDGETNTTEYFANGNVVTQTHAWKSPGIYTIVVESYDNETYSGTTSHVVSIDAHLVKSIGYIVDDDADGIYDTFHDNGVETILGQQDEKYLIDNDGDDEWDYVYDIDTSELTEYEGEPTQPEPGEPENDYSFITILMIVLIVLITVFSILIKKEKPPSKPAPTPKKSNAKNKKKSPAKTKKTTTKTSSSSKKKSPGKTKTKTKK